LKRKLLPQASTSKETELAEIQKKAEYDKQYRLKRKLLLQQQISTSTETDLVKKQKKAEYNKQYRVKLKMQMQQQASTYSETESVPSRLRHINDSVLSSLKMEVVRLSFFYAL
jgi:hypothetical protein